MPLTKQYLRYIPSGSFNIIASPGCNSAWTTLKGQDGRFIASGTCEDITVWDLQLGEKAAVFPGEKSEVSILCSSPLKRYLAAGFRDGSVKTYNVETGENMAVFSGHKSTVNCLAYDLNGHRLSSGSKDTHIVVWDIVAENGISRLSSHTGPVTQVAFMDTYNTLVSSSEDTSIKFWDLETNYCFKTILGHRTEVWGFVLMRSGDFLVTGCGDSELRVWNLHHSLVKSEAGTDTLNEEGEQDELSPIQSVKAGSVLRSTTGRVLGITQAEGRYLAVHGASDTLELFLFHSHLEAIKRLRKRKKKEKKQSGENQENNAEEALVPVLQDVVKRMAVVKTKGKIKSVSLVVGKGTQLRILITLNNNTIEVYGVDMSTSDAPSLIKRIAQKGHHSEVRALVFSSDNLAIASGSADSVKLWNRSSLACLRTVSTGYVLCLLFVPGDRHVIAGLKDGKILIIDVGVGEILEEIPGHETEVWSLALLPNQRGCVSGSGDSSVKFWDFELLDDDQGRGKVLSLLHKRTLTVEDPVLCVRISPDSKIIAVALLDMTIKVFFLDTLKFFLSLYGHKLPVTTMDISSDSSLLVSGSADRNIKLWGLDFGDCHKSLFAHDSAISCVQFVNDTHYFFSCGKEGQVKQWDGDSYDKIIAFKGHFGEAWTLAVSPNGDHVVSAGSDRVIRLFSKTEEPLVLEDEAEEERAREDEDVLLTGPESLVKGQGELNLASRKTVSSERGAEQLLECLEVSMQYENALAEFEETGKRGQPPTKPPLMIAYQVDTPDEFLVDTIKRIRASDLEEALLLLPFSAACDLLNRLPSLLRKGQEVELVAKTLTFLLKVHHGPIVSSKELMPVLNKLQKISSRQVNALRDLVGCNLYGMQYIQREIEDKEGIQLFREATIEQKERTKKKKRKERALKRAVLSL